MSVPKSIFRSFCILLLTLSLAFGVLTVTSNKAQAANDLTENIKNLSTNTVTGGDWARLGSTPLNGAINAIAVSGTNVYVGGEFTDAGGNPHADYIAKWDGTSWSALGGGLSYTVYAIAVSGTNIYVAGRFLNAGGNQNADHIAKWNGTSWSALGTGITSGGDVLALAVNGTDVYAGGYFADAGGNPNADWIAKWNGASWSALGIGNAGLNGGVFALAVNGTTIYAGGDFSDVGNNPNADYLLKWNGTSWSTLGTTPLNWYVNTIAVNGTGVYAGGGFGNAGGNANADWAAKWNGTNWAGLGTPPLTYYVKAIAVSGSDVYVGGSFMDAGGDIVADYIVKWNGTTWSTLGSSPFPYDVYAIAISGTQIYAGGYNGYIARFKPYVTAQFNSLAAQDGWILESDEASNIGGLVNNAWLINIGDNDAKQQYRSILSFNTSNLPDAAIITEVALKLKKNSVVGGGNPLAIFQGLFFDVKKGFFGTPALEISDFQATASGTYGPANYPLLVGDVYTFNLNGSKNNINKLATNGGLTQIRLRFNLDDNNNAVENSLRLYSGESATAANRPQLVITYHTP